MSGFGSKYDLDKFFADQGVSDPLDSILPSGRAPRGRGQEYKDRRAIVGKIRTQQGYRAQLQTKANNYRGTKSGRWQMTYTKERIGALNKAIDTAMSIAEGPGDWGFKKELINGLFDYTSAVSTG